MDTKGTKERTHLKPNEASHAVIGCAMKVHTLQRFINGPEGEL
jgi:hypothetical protein